MSITHLPGYPECIAVEVESSSYGFTVYNKERMSTLCFEAMGWSERVNIPYEGPWEIVGLASELVKVVSNFMVHMRTDTAYATEESVYIAELPDRFKAANLDPEKEYVILRKTN